MKDQARFIAYKVLTEVEKNEAYSNIVINKWFKKYPLNSMDKALITELVYGVLRMREHLDYIIRLFSHKPIEKLDIRVLILLRLGLYQIKFLEKIPVRAAIYTTVEVAKREHHDGVGKFINGILRNIDRGLQKVKFPDIKKDPLKFISSYYSHPRWLVQKWIDRFGVDEAIDFCAANNRTIPVTIRVNTLRTNPDELMMKFSEQGIKMRKLPFPEEGLVIENATGFMELPQFKEGLFTIQGQASMLVAHALRPEPGMKVIDLCAAPGGKTTHIAALMKNQGKILATDIHPHKVQLIKENCSRLGISNVETLCVDVTTLQLGDREFDRVLLDAPCSGLGLLAQKPEIRWFKKPEDISKLTGLQLRLFKKGLSLLKTGGIMVYSTCTVVEEENQEILRKILATEDVELLDLRYLIPLDIRDRFKEMGLDTPYLEFYPHISRTEGFFIAAIRKLK